MKKKVEKYCLINDEKLDIDIKELQEQLNVLSTLMKNVSELNKYKKLVLLKRETMDMITELEDKKLVNKEFLKKLPK